MNHDYAHCLDYDSSVCPSDCFRAQLVEDLRKRKDKVGIPVSWINFRNLSECALNTPKEGIMKNGDAIRAMTDEQLAKWMNDHNFNCPPVSCTEGGCEECWLDWLKQEAEE